jgi:SSS family solute:Na+ symporter
MIVGFAVGLFRMLVDTPVSMEHKEYTKDSFLWIINHINFQYFSILITLISAFVLVVVSYMTEVPDYQKIQGLTFATASKEDNAKTRASWGVGEVAASVFVLVCIIGAYLYFTG